MAKSKRNKPSDNTIAQNKRARFDYHLLQSFEAGVSLAGWEVKSLRAGKVQLTDSYVLMKGGRRFLGRKHYATRYGIHALRIGSHPPENYSCTKKSWHKSTPVSRKRVKPACAPRYIGKDIW